jgi:uncharacterized protein YggE
LPSDTPPAAIVRCVVDDDGPVDCITVVGAGAAVAEVDGAVLRLGLEVTAATAAAALAELAQRSETVLTAGRAAGLTSTELQTQGLSLQPRWDGPSQRVVGYRAEHTLSVVVVVADVTAAPQLIDALSGAAGDALRLGGLVMTSSSEPAARGDAAERALHNARQQAERLARAAGVALGRVLTIRELPTGRRFPGGTVFLAAASQPGAASAAVPVEAGSATIATELTVSYAIDGSLNPETTPH